MKIVINEPPRSKKNSMQIVKVKGRPIIVQSVKYKEYEKACAKYFIGWKQEPIDYPIRVKCEFYRATKHRVDLTNLLASILDILTKYGVIADDNRDVVVSVDGSRVFYDKANPRTEIEITQYEGEYEVWK